MLNKKTSIFLSVLLLALGIVMLIPFAVMLSTALKSMEEIYSRGGILHFFIPNEIHFENFIDAFKFGNADWMKYFKNSLVVTLVTTFISLFINSMAGYAFARLNFKGRDSLFFASLVGMMIPPQVTMVTKAIQCGSPSDSFCPVAFSLQRTVEGPAKEASFV